jgi:hypothetical protein
VWRRKDARLAKTVGHHAPAATRVRGATPIGDGVRVDERCRNADAGRVNADGQEGGRKAVGLSSREFRHAVEHQLKLALDARWLFGATDEGPQQSRRAGRHQDARSVREYYQHHGGREKVGHVVAQYPALDIWLMIRCRMFQVDIPCRLARLRGCFPPAFPRRHGPCLAAWPWRCRPPSRSRPPGRPMARAASPAASV